MTQTPDLVLLERLREVLADQPVTETELRVLIEQADGLVRTLGAHMAGSERRLNELTPIRTARSPRSLRSCTGSKACGRGSTKLGTLLRDLEARARELRTSWLIRQAEGPLAR